MSTTTGAARERPISMTTPNALKTWNGLKTETRRPVSPQPEQQVMPRQAFAALEAIAGPHDPHGWAYKGVRILPWPGSMRNFCPYGRPGDRLWVREEHYAFGEWKLTGGLTKKSGKPKQHFVPMHDLEPHYPDNIPTGPRKKPGWEFWWNHIAKKDEVGWHKRLARFMPRRYARMFMEIVSVRAERLHDITEAGAIAEGVERLWTREEWEQTLSVRASYPAYEEVPWTNYLWHGHADVTSAQADAWPHQFSGYKTAVESYSSLWEKIYGPGSWDRNEWVWVISYKLLS